MITYLYPQLGIVIGVSLLILVALGLIVGAVAVYRNLQDDPYNDGALLWMPVGVLLVAAVGALVGAVFAVWPLQPRYWGNYSVDGTVTSINRQLTSGGEGGTFTQYVIRVQGVRQVVVVDDSRMSAVRTGEHVSLFCQLEWQPAAATVIECSSLRSQP